SACTSKTEFPEETIAAAIENGRQANEGFERSLHFTKAWLTKTDSATGLIPTNLTNKTDVWEPHNSAADNYAFMVLTAYLLDKDLYNGELREMLKTEKELTSRIKSLPDTWSFSKQDFITPKPLPGTIIFGTSEYIKDGLVPLMEYIGPSPWNDRMMEMLDDLKEYMKEAGSLESVYPERMASVEEVNGEMLQTLSRVYWMTGEQKYLDWAIEIGDYYLLGQRDLSQIEYLRIRDHGCEIIGGLSELYVTLHCVDPEKKEQYKPALYKLLDRVLEVGRNQDGLFYNAINAKTGEIADEKIVDNWGYTFNAYYSVWLVDQKEEYRQAVLKGFEKLNENYRNYAWEGTSHDGYADALESGINLYNR
ncbi:MAG: glycoside hydrolase family 76 protein, partial [Bacteroidales bacterium]|nr:glycoside hydrolase family 76 protein [Bacteroidales bacterium]